MFLIGIYSTANFKIMKKNKLPNKNQIIDIDLCFEYEEALLTSHQNLDKIKRKENKW